MESVVKKPVGVLIGITGGIGAGKSVVSRVLRLMGFEVYDCDLQAKLLMDGDKLLHAEIRERLGEECLNSDGSLCRPAIASRIFADVEARSWLNSRVHSAVHGDILNSFIGNKTKSEALTVNEDLPSDIRFVEAAVFRSSGLWRLCEEIWIVDAPEEMRIERVMARSGLTPDEIKARMESQKEEFDFSSVMPFSRVRRIINDGVTPLLSQIKEYLKQK